MNFLKKALLSCGILVSIQSPHAHLHAEAPGINPVIFALSVPLIAGTTFAILGDLYTFSNEVARLRRMDILPTALDVKTFASTLAFKYAIPVAAAYKIVNLYMSNVGEKNQYLYTFLISFITSILLNSRLGSNLAWLGGKALSSGWNWLRGNSAGGVAQEPYIPQPQRSNMQPAPAITQPASVKPRSRYADFTEHGSL